MIDNKVTTATQRVWGQCRAGVLDLVNGQAGDARRWNGLRGHREPQSPGQVAPGEPLKRETDGESEAMGRFHEKRGVLSGQ